MATSAMAQPPKAAQVDGELDPMPQPRLDRLPEELVSNIALRLDYDDITSLRLVNRTIEARSFHDFATEYFSAKAFMISTDSLKSLTAIANDKRLRKYLRSIYIVTAFFHDSAFKCANGCHCTWRPSTRQAEAYRLYIQDQQQLKEGGEGKPDGKQMLIDAFKQLPNVTSLYLADSPSHGEEIENAELYGLRKVIRRTGRAPSHCPSTDKTNKEYSAWCTWVWKIMCQAVAKGELNTLVHLGTQITKTPDGLSVRGDLKLGPLTIAGMTKALQNLKSVRFSIQANTLVRNEGSVDRPASRKVIGNFAGALRQPHLEDVTVSYDMTHNSGLVHMSLMKGLEVGKLKKLAVDGLYIKTSQLVGVVNAVTSITDFQISWSNLTQGNWVPILQALQKLEHLDHLHLMWLQEAGRKVYFLPQREPEDDERDEWLDDGADVFDGEEDDDADDDSLPDLEPVGLGNLAPGLEHVHTMIDDASIPWPTVPPPAAPDAEEDFTAPGHEGHGSLERGYYICLKGDAQIKKHLPIFIKEYNLGESLDDQHHHGMALPLPLPVGPGGPAAFATMMAGLFGGPPPPPGPGANGHGHAHGHGHGHGHDYAAAAGGADGQQDPFGPPPPGFVTVGNGPGYQVSMSAQPMPVGGGHGYGPADHAHGYAGGPIPPPPGFPLAGGGATAAGQANAGAADNWEDGPEQEGGWWSPDVEDVD